jgi:predicted ATPase/DNA-binding winged helix-turn-helix (wHTH) protein
MAHTYQFGLFELVPDRNVLLREGNPVRLGSRAFAILVLLVENGDRIVPSEELTARVWPNINVSDSNLRVHLAAIRKALSDCNDGHEAILTAPGIGYRFAMPVTVQKVSVHQRSNSNVPAQLTDLIGRDAVIKELVESVEKCRFVSIIGSGGIGKTSVALAVGRKAMERYSEGACFVDLSSLDSQSPLLFAVASALKLKLLSGDDKTPIVDALRSREMLLVLDNCEQVVDKAANLAEAVLRECPNVHLLATSREPLRAEGEFVRRLLPLQSPPVSEASLSLSEALTFPAVELFVQRALASFPGFRPHDTDGPVLAKICGKLDGIPLAIELAATRVDLFDLRKLAEELDNSLRLLTRGRRTAQERHRTLRATLDWSFRLLTQEEQWLFVRLSVFRNSFDREAALSVSVDQKLTREQVLDGLANLTAKSLLMISSEKDTTPLYRFLESARAYANEKLSRSEEDHPIRARHVAYLLQELKRIDTKLIRTTANHGRYSRLADEIRAAIAWSFSNADDVMGIQLITSSAYLWSELSLFEEFEHYANKALTVIQGTPDRTREELQLLNVLGPAIYETRGSVPELYTTASRVLELAEWLKDRQAETGGLHSLWRYYQGRGEYRKGLEITERIRQSLESNGNGELWWKPLRALALLYQGNLHESQETIAGIDQRIPFPDSGVSASFDYNVAVIVNGTLARILWLKGMFDSASLCADAALSSALGAGQAVSICFSLAIGGCSVAMWNRDVSGVERRLCILREHAMRAKSLYWLQYVNVFEVGLMAAQRPEDAKLLLAKAQTAKWDYRHWENFSVLGEGFAPPEFLDRARHDDHWWCSPEILRLEAHRICRESARRDRDGVCALLLQALETAQKQKALAWELRIAMSFVEFAQSPDERRQARTLLSTTLSDFSEGFRFDIVRDAELLLERTSRFA